MFPLFRTEPAGEIDVSVSAFGGPALSTFAIALADDDPTLPTLSVELFAVLVALAVLTVVSLPAVSVTFVQLPLKEPQLPPESVTSSRCTTLEPAARPEPPSLPPFSVTPTERRRVVAGGDGRGSDARRGRVVDDRHDQG